MVLPLEWKSEILDSDGVVLAFELLFRCHVLDGIVCFQTMFSQMLFMLEIFV